MNARACDVVAALRGVLGKVPEANEISLHDFQSGWTLVRIVAPTDGAVHRLCADLGLGPPETKSHQGWRWLRAAASVQRILRVTVIGPLHDERLSRSEEGERAMTPTVPRSPR
jgi:hypothetical protein